VAQQHAKAPAYREQLLDGIAKKRVWNLVVSGLVTHVTILGNGCGNGLGAHIPSGCPMADYLLNRLRCILDVRAILHVVEDDI